MKIKGLIDEDFINYKKPSMVIICPKCDFKCDKECGQPVCQNSALALAPITLMKNSSLVDRYVKNDISQAIIFQGLEPIDEWEDLWHCICEFRHYTLDDIIIYTGYTEEEVYNMRYVLSNLKQFPNIIIKFGRYIPNQKPHYDEVLGVELASDNQYAKVIS